MEEKSYTLKEISEMTNKTIKFLRREVASNRLKRIDNNRTIRISKKEVDKWIANNKEININENTFSLKQDNVNWINISNEMQKINCWNETNKISEYNFIDLFSGAGGLSCGLVMAGFNPIGTVEIMKEAVETYKHNFIEKKGFDERVENKDIREEMVKSELINSVKDKHIHLIAGGFPCQGFSMAGNRILTDKRNSLYLEMLDIVNRLKPDFIIMENVEGLRSMYKGKIEKQIIEDYKNIGYKINVTTLNSADYGVAQLRKRVIFIGNRLNIENFHPKPIYTKQNYKTVKDALEKYLNMNENKEINHIFTRHSEDMKKRLAKLEIGKSLYDNYSDGWKKVYWDRPSCTVKENHGGVNVHPINNRTMTPRELASLQSFPDDFIFKGSKKWQLVQIGNAVPPLLGKAIGLAVKKTLDGYYKKKEL